MALHLPNGETHVAPEYQDLARKLVEGDGLGWPGDPRLSLSIGVVEKKRYGRTVATGRRLEVHRHNEDGTDTLVAHFLPTEQHLICWTLAQMRLDSPGHEDVLDRIDRHNAQIEKAASERFQGIMGEMLEYAARLNHDRNEPRNTHYLSGIGGATKA